MSRFLKVTIYLLPILVLLVLLGAWFWSADFEAVKAFIDAKAGDGNVESYTLQFHERIRTNLLLAAGFVGFGVLLIILLHKRVVYALQQLLGDGQLLVLSGKQTLKRLSGDRDYLHWAIFAGILGLGTFLRWERITDLVTYDEAFNYTYFIKRPWYIILSEYSYPNNHILHTLFAKWSIQLFGLSEWAQRLPAFIAGMLSFPLIYGLVRWQANKRAALFAMGLFAVATPVITFHAFARGYSFSWFFLLLQLIAVMHYVKHKNRMALLLVAGLGALAAYSVFAAMYQNVVVFTWFGWLLWQKHKTLASILPMIYAGLGFTFLITLFYLPVLVTYGWQQLFYDPTMGPRSCEYFTSTFQKQCADILNYWGDGNALRLLLFFLVPCGIGVAINGYVRRWFLCILLLVPILVGLQMIIGPPRIWTWLLITVIIGGAVGWSWLVDRLSQKWTGVSVVALLSAFLLTYSSASERFFYPLEESPLLTSYFAQKLKAHDRILVQVPAEAQLEYHFEMKGIPQAMLYQTPQKKGNVYLVVKPAWGQTINSVFEAEHVLPEQFTIPELEQVLGAVQIYSCKLKG